MTSNCERWPTYDAAPGARSSLHASPQEVTDAAVRRNHNRDLCRPIKFKK